MALEVDIKANDEFEKSALATAKALDAIAKQEAKINALSTKLGKSTKDIAAAQRHIAAQSMSDERQLKEQTDARSKAEDEHEEKIKKGAIAFGLFTAAGAAALAVTYELGKSLAEAAFEADKTRRGAEAMVNAYTGGHGPEVLKQLDTLAGQLGQSVDETRQKFVEFRKAGVNNQIAGQLLKIRADLLATGLSAADADKEIAPVLGSGRNAAMAKIQIGFIEKAFKGVGDGAKAAAYGIASVEGAQNKFNNAKVEALADLWVDIGPSVGKAAHELADFGVEILKSEGGQSAIHAIGDAFKALPGAIKTGIDAIKGTYNFIIDHKTGVVAALGAIGVAMAIAFGPAIYAGASIAAVFLALPVAIGVAAVAVGIAAQSIVDNWEGIKFTFNAGVDALMAFGKKIEDGVYLIADSMIKGGAAIIEGLVKGIENGIGWASDAISDLAHKISHTFTDALGIHSPSAVFAGYGKNTVEGYNKGQEQAMNSDPPPLQGAALRAPASASNSGGGGLTFTIHNLIVNGGGTPEENGRAIRQEIQLLLQAGQLSYGGA